jgi:hypothetical protein
MPGTVPASAIPSHHRTQGLFCFAFWLPWLHIIALLQARKKDRGEEEKKAYTVVFVALVQSFHERVLLFVSQHSIPLNSSSSTSSFAVLSLSSFKKCYRSGR